MVAITDVTLRPPISAQFVPVHIETDGVWPVLQIRIGAGIGAVQQQSYDPDTDSSVIIGLLPRADVRDGARLSLRHLDHRTGVIGTSTYIVRTRATAIRRRGGQRPTPGLSTSRVGRQMALSRTARR